MTSSSQRYVFLNKYMLRNRKLLNQKNIEVAQPIQIRNHSELSLKSRNVLLDHCPDETSLLPFSSASVLPSLS